MNSICFYLKLRAINNLTRDINFVRMLKHGVQRKRRIMEASDRKTPSDGRTNDSSILSIRLNIETAGKSGFRSCGP